MDEDRSETAKPRTEIKESVVSGDGTQFEQRLKSYPCLFNLQMDISTDWLEKLGKKIKGILKIQKGSETTKPAKGRRHGKSLTRAKCSHRSDILAHVNWRLKNTQEAQQAAEEALREHPSCILARTNMAYIQWRKGKDTCAEKHLNALTKLKTEDQEYEDLIIEARLGLAYFLYSFGPYFGVYAADLYEAILKERPDHDRTKLYLARVILKMKFMHTKAKLDSANDTLSLERAMDLLNEVKNRQENEPSLRGEAAADLGRLLTMYNAKEEQVLIVKEKAERLRLNAELCFTEARKYAKDRPRVLLGAGKYFRNQGKEEEAKKCFESLLVLQPDAGNGYYNLGLTFKKMAFQRNRRPRIWQTVKYHPLEMINKSTNNVVLFKSDAYVEDTLKCFHKAMKLRWDHYPDVSYNLGLMYSAVGELAPALDHFQQVVEKEDREHFIVNALEQSGLVMMRVESWMTQCKDQLKETAQHLLKMAVILQTRLVLQNRQYRDHDRKVWKSFFTVSTSLSLPLDELLKDKPVDECWLLRLLKRHAVTFPVRYEKTQAEDVHFLKDRLDDLQQDQHYHDAVLFMALLKLTDMRLALNKWWDGGLDLHVLVQAARKLLSSEIGQNGVYCRVNANAAALLFRWAFEDRYCVATPGKPQHDDLTDPDLGSTDELHMLIVHESRDTDDATTLQRVLQGTCGLKTRTCSTADSSTFCVMVKAARIVLFLVTTDSISEELERLASEAVAKVTPSHTGAGSDPSEKPSVTSELVLSVVKGNATLPPPLQGFPSLPWNLELAEPHPERSLSEGQISAVCELFCFLLGLKMKWK